DARLDAGFARQPLAFELGLLIDVARLQRRLLVRRWAFDVPVDADGAAMNDAPGAAAGGRLDDVAYGRGVHGAIDVAAKAGPPIKRRNVIDDIDAAGGRRECGRIAQIADPDADAGVRQRRGSGPLRA